MTSPLRALLKIISDSVDAIERSCEERGAVFPSLDDAYSPEKERVVQGAAVEQATTLITSAAYQLIATVQQPQTSIFAAMGSYYLPVSLRAAIETNTVEILREAGPQGLHVKDIASKASVDSTKLSRFLRYLATYHIFKEVAPDIFANNRLSSVCDTGKSVSELFEKPLEKHHGTNGLSALIGHCTDEDYKGAGYAVEHLQDSKTAFDDGPINTPMMRAFNYDKGVWSWFEQPFNTLRFKRFGVAMDGVNSVQPAESILKGFAWDSLMPGDVVVDVGGGIGVSCLTLAKKYPNLKYIVQDRPSVVVEGRKHCEQIFPEALKTGCIEYQPHDFFDVQPRNDVKIFVLKQIMHDWSDEYIARILRRLRAGASSETKLLVIDSIIPYSCPDETTVGDFKFRSPPEPLLANMGAANIAPYIVDLSMYVHFNAMERTLVQIVNLLNDAGWKLVQVNTTDNIGSHLPHMVAIPV